MVFAPRPYLLYNLCHEHPVKKDLKCKITLVLYTVYVKYVYRYLNFTFAFTYTQLKGKMYLNLIIISK